MQLPIHRAACALALTLVIAGAAGAAPYADTVVSYDPGTGALAGYDDATVSLGSPSRTTGGPSDVTVFNSPYLPADIVSIGEGGHLTVRFDDPVENDPLNPFGVDLIVFGNAFFVSPFEPPFGVVDLAEEPAQISVSQDGITFLQLATPLADSLFPTQGFLDTSDPFGGFGGFGDGTIPTDFTRPVDPNLTLSDFLGLDYAAVLALYSGSGGGAGVDLADVGLDWIQYVRIDGLSGSAEIDGFADVVAVGEPGAVSLLLMSLAALARRRL